MKYVLITLAVIFLLAMIVLGPLATIASMNTLFGLDIAYTFWNWLSMVWLQWITFGGVIYALTKQKKG